jgi:hypothetical protein
MTNWDKEVIADQAKVGHSLNLNWNNSIKQNTVDKEKLIIRKINLSKIKPINLIQFMILMITQTKWRIWWIKHHSIFLAFPNLKTIKFQMKIKILH